MGTLVVRAALAHPLMAPYLEKLHSFLSLGGTHLGYTYANNTLLSSAMWFYQRWSKSTSLQQLTIKDASTPEQSYIYHLSQAKTLSHFKNIILVGSGQDRYAPFYSARMQIAPSASQQSQLGAATVKMIQGLMQPVVEGKKTRVTRLSICFGKTGAFIDEAIGRAAHIQFLEDHSLINLIIVYFADLLN